MANEAGDQVVTMLPISHRDATEIPGLSKAALTVLRDTREARLMGEIQREGEGYDARMRRISRDTTDLLVIARQMHEAGAGLRSLAEPFLDTTSDFAKIVLAILGVAAKLERRRILGRAANGRATAKAQGVKFGRKPKLTEHQKREARARVAAGETQRSVARSYNVSQSTISRHAPPVSSV